MPQVPKPVEGQVEQRVHEQVAERDDGRHPVRLQAEEGPVQEQHRAVEDEPGAEGGERRGHHRRLVRMPGAALEEDADDRLGEHGADDRRRREQEHDLPEAQRDGGAKARHVTARGQPREGREEHRRHGHREHPLRQHVDEEGLLDRRRRQVAVDQAAGEEGVDECVDVDQAQAERHRQHQLEDTPDGRVAPVDQHAQALVAAVETAQPGHGQEDLDECRGENRGRVDVQLSAPRMRLRDADRQAGDDRQVPEHRRERRHREVVVAVQDSDDDPRDAEQRDDREQHLRETDGESAVVTGVAEQADHPGRHQDEQGAQPSQAEQHQPEQARGDAPGPPALALLEQIAEHRNEGRGESRVGNQRPHEVRHLEGNGEGVDPARGAEVVGGDHLADKPEHPGDRGRQSEDRARDRQPAAVRAGSESAVVGYDLGDRAGYGLLIHGAEYRLTPRPAERLSGSGTGDVLRNPQPATPLFGTSRGGERCEPGSDGSTGEGRSR